MLCLSSCTRAATPTIAPAVPAPPALGRGVNLGNALEAPREGQWGVTLREEYFQLIKDASFQHVRIPIRWNAHAAPQTPYAVEEAFFRRVDWAVEQALSRGLITIINLHHYDELHQDPAGHRERFLALWEQIAAHYRAYPDALLFELLNEPHDRLNASEWNKLLREALVVVRRSNPTRWVIIGGVNWSNVGALSSLDLPEDDRRLIATFHYYEPFRFTHQGAEWVQGSAPWLGETWMGTEGQQHAVRNDLERAAAWGIKYRRPLYLGEFGAYSKAAMDSRARWTAFVARTAEEQGIPWAYWEFCAGFGVYDPVAGQWREPLLRALIPQ